MTAGVRVGIVAAAATTGALVGLGLRHGLALRPFSNAGRSLLATIGVDSAPAVVAVIVGLAVLVAAIIVLGVCFTVVAATLRGARLIAVAMLFSAIGWVVSAYVVRAMLASSTGAVLGTAQRVFVCALLAFALVAGMRLARPEVRGD